MGRGPRAGCARCCGRLGGSPAVEALAEAQSERDVYLVLDQAEEYFLYHADDAGPGSFAEALPALLSAPLRVNVLVSLREDSLAKLDRFGGRISGLFSNTLRLDRLDRVAAEAAIVRPVERFSEIVGEEITVEPALAERVLDEVGTGRIESALGGLGGVEDERASARIEAPYLQLVMQRLWEEERAEGSSELRAATLDRLGGARQIVEEHLEGALPGLSPVQKDVAAKLFNHLVTPSGTKISHEVSDLADFGGRAVEEVVPVLRGSSTGGSCARSRKVASATRSSTTCSRSLFSPGGRPRSRRRAGAGASCRSEEAAAAARTARRRRLSPGSDGRRHGLRARPAE